MAKVFLDTNIFVYCADRHDKKRQRQARELVRTVAASQEGVISTQVLQEFFVAATRKVGLAPLDAKALVQSYSRFETVLIDPDLIQSAVDCSILNQISFWDALIIVAAESARCQTVYSEDLNPGQIIHGVRVLNPF